MGIGPRASSSSSAAELQGPDQVEKSLEIFWPQDLLPHAIPDCRIASWGYNVDLRVTRGSTSTATVFDHARTLLSDLAGMRVTEDERKQPIIFVAHSLGGIAVKDVRVHPQRGSVKFHVLRLLLLSPSTESPYRNHVLLHRGWITVTLLLMYVLLFWALNTSHTESTYSRDIFLLHTGYASWGLYIVAHRTLLLQKRYRD